MFPGAPDSTLGRCHRPLAMESGTGAAGVPTGRGISANTALPTTCEFLYALKPSELDAAETCSMADLKEEASTALEQADETDDVEQELKVEESHYRRKRPL